MLRAAFQTGPRAGLGPQLGRLRACPWQSIALRNKSDSCDECVERSGLGGLDIQSTERSKAAVLELTSDEEVDMALRGLGAWGGGWANERWV